MTNLINPSCWRRTNYLSHDEIPKDIADIVRLASGEKNITDLSLADINGWVDMMEENCPILIEDLR